MHRWNQGPRELVVLDRSIVMALFLMVARWEFASDPTEQVELR